MADKTPSGPHDGIYCAFCGKVPEQVNAMISGPNGIFICDECISVSVDAMLTDLSMRTFSQNPRLQGRKTST